MRVAYLVNQYPQVSTSFIRREIAGIEACGIDVERFSIRSREFELVDQADLQELRNTRVVLLQTSYQYSYPGLAFIIGSPKY